MTSDMILESDKRQSISEADVTHFAQAVPARRNEKTGHMIAGREPIHLKAGVVCGANPDHGRMLMSAKTGHLECGRGGCDYQAVVPKD